MPKSSGSRIESPSSTGTRQAMSPTKRSAWQPVSAPPGSAGGVAGTMDLLAKSLGAGGIMLIGEPYWLRLPPTEEVAKGCFAGSMADFSLLPELLASFGDLGYDVVEMVLADQQSWDRYEAAKWLTMRRWLEANPDDDFAEEVRASLASEPRRHAAYTREYLGWGVFALMAR